MEVGVSISLKTERIVIKTLPFSGRHRNEIEEVSTRACSIFVLV